MRARLPPMFVAALQQRRSRPRWSRHWRPAGRRREAPPSSARRGPGAATPPPMKTASGGASPSSAAGAFPATTLDLRRAERCRIRADDVAALGIALDGDGAHCRGRSAAIRSRSSRSRRPTSQSRCPGSGARAARVTARTSRLVICPSWAKASSGKPGRRGRLTVPGAGNAFDRQRVEIGRAGLPFQLSAVASTIRSCGPPICSRTISRLGPQPRRVELARRPSPASSRRGKAAAAGRRG